MAAALRRASELFGEPREGDVIFYLGDGIDTLSGLEPERSGIFPPAESASVAPGVKTWPTILNCVVSIMSMGGSPGTHGSRPIAKGVPCSSVQRLGPPPTSGPSTRKTS